MNFALGDICAKESVPVFEYLLASIHRHSHEQQTHTSVMFIDGVITFSSDIAVPY